MASGKSALAGPLAALSGTQDPLPSLHHLKLLTGSDCWRSFYKNSVKAPNTSAAPTSNCSKKPLRIGPHHARAATFALILVGDPYLLSALRLRSIGHFISRIAAHATD